MKKISSRVIILILTVAFILSPGLAVEPITTAGVILGAKVVGWAATGISAAKTTAEIAYQQHVSRESVQLYEQQLEHIDDELLTTGYKIQALEEDPEKLRKLMSKEKALSREKQSLSAVLLAIKENRDVVIKKKATKEIKKIATGYVIGELVPITAGRELTKAGKDLLGAIYTLQDTISGIPPDAKEAWLKSNISAEDKQFYSIIAAEKVPRKIDVAISKAEFDKYINEIAKPMFKDFLENKNDDFTKLPPAIKKMLWGELEAKKAERAKQQQKLEEEYRKMREEYMKNKEKMAQTRLEVVQEAPEVIQGFEQIVAQEPEGDDEKLVERIVSSALIAGKILTGEVEIPQEQEVEEVPVTARGKLLTDWQLQGLKKSLVGRGCPVYQIRDDKNYLSLSFDLDGDEVTGSYTWQYSFRYGIPVTDEPTSFTATNVTKRYTVNLTGTYSGGKTGTFQGKLAGSGTDRLSSGEDIHITTRYKISGTWSAQMTSNGQISGLLKYTVRYPKAAHREEFKFTASLVE